MRFKSSILSYHASQCKVSTLICSNTIPTLAEYLPTRREIYGSSLLFGLAELLEVFPFPDFLPETLKDKLEEIKNCAFDLIAWAMVSHCSDVALVPEPVSLHQDVASYHAFPNAHSYNLITILMTHNHLSIQGAMHLAGNMIKDAFTSFSALEEHLLNSIQPRPIIPPFLLSLLKWNRGGSSEDVNNDEIGARTADLRRYIQALKDCIVGSIHWIYETELFFGKRGGEVRTFGWVFANISGEGFE